MPAKQRFDKPNRTGRNNFREQYFKLSYPMARSAAWRSLSGGAVKIFIELRCRFNGGNNGKLALSMDQAARLLGMSKSTAMSALRELEAKGFIAVTRPGQWYGRLATLYAVTDKPVNGHLPTNAWKDWRPPRKTDRRYSHRTYLGADGSAGVPKR